MNRRRIAAAGAVAVLALTACGGSSGPSALSEEDFIDDLTDLCEDTKKDLDKIDLPEDVADMERFAGDITEIYVDAQDRLKGLIPPEDFARDFGDFRDLIDETLDLLDDLEKAGKDDDEKEVEKLFTKLKGISDDQTAIADDLGIAECGADEESSDTTTGETVPLETAPVTTLPATPLTLPPTLPPATAAPVGTDPAGTALFTVMDVATEYFAPSGFTLISKTPDDNTLNAVANSELNTEMDRFGVATLVDDAGTEVADIWLGVAVSEERGMPPAWIALDCGTDGELRESDGGIVGIVCPAAVDSPFWEIFTATSNAIGISVYTRLPNITGDLVADAFLEANL